MVAVMIVVMSIDNLNFLFCSENIAVMKQLKKNIVSIENNITSIIRLSLVLLCYKGE